MVQPWVAEFPITHDLVRGLIEQQFPNLSPADISPIGEGWDNAAFLINQRYVFRFPKREVADPAMLKEQRILPLLAAKLPLPIPLPLFHGQPQDDYPWHFAGYEEVPGSLGCKARLSDAERAACAKPLGEFLASLHRVSGQLPKDILPEDPYGRCDIEKTLNRLSTYLEKTGNGLAPAFKTSMELLLENPPHLNLRRDTVVHGDMYVRHLLMGPHHDLAGVIDWGDCCLADPGVDLAIAWTFLPPQAQQPFLEAYGPVSPDSWCYAAMFGAFYGMVLSYFGRETCDTDLQFEAEQILRYWETYCLSPPWIR